MATPKKGGIKIDPLPKRAGYVEPKGYIPKSVRKQTGVGEYAGKSNKK